MSNSEETVKADPTLTDVMNELIKINRRLDRHDVQLEAIRQGLVENSAGFDRLEALALEAKSIALITRSQLTILTEQMRRKQSETV